ncbi:MAG: translocation/assembly module TamB domain-containing protein [Gemmatimonadaceae bacterium]
MSRRRRVLLTVLASVVGLTALAVVAALVLTGTDWGRERVRRAIVSALEDKAHGRVHLGRVSGNLLKGITFHNFVITDSAGAPFVAVERMSARYKILRLLRKRVELDDVLLVRPVIVLDRPPGGRWNYRRIFPDDTLPVAKDTTPGWGDWLAFTDVTVVDGRLLVRTPWRPGSELAPSAQAEQTREALSGKGRLLIVNAPPPFSGYQKVVEMRAVNARMPLVRLADPALASRIIQVASMSATALPFRPPAAELRNVVGRFEFTGDSLWWRGAQVTMPGSRMTGDGAYVFNNGDMWITALGRPVALADMRWLYPRLPSSGGGPMDVALRWDSDRDDYIVRNMDVRTSGARIRGQAGVTLADTFTIHDTDVRIANLDTRLIEQVVPQFESPRRGTLNGRAQLAGGKQALRVNGDIAFTDPRSGTSRLAAIGEVGFLGDGGDDGIRARNLRLRLLPIQVHLARIVEPDLPIGGTVTGTATLNGDTRSRLTAVGDLTHVDRGALSRVTGRGDVRLTGARWFDVDARLHPLELATAGRFAPDIGLRGSASGPIRLTGTLADLRIATNLTFADGGSVAARGRLDLQGTIGYDLTAMTQTLNLNAFLASGPVTSFNGGIMARGSGTDPATMRAAVAADLVSSRFRDYGVDSATLRVNIANGLLSVARAHAVGYGAVADVRGAFGLAAGRSGELTYTLSIDSLGVLNPFIPRDPADTGHVRPRPGILAERVRRARADSMRIAVATEVERAITGAPPPRLVVDTPRVVPRDTIAGSLYASGVLRGNIRNFDLRGRAAGEGLIFRGHAARSFRTEYAWTDARTRNSTMAVAFQGDSVSVAGFHFDTLDARLSYQAPRGRVELLARQGPRRDYALRGNFVLHDQHNELHVSDVTLRFDTTRWTMPRPAAIRWGRRGLEVDNVELVNGPTGRVFVDGLLPTEGVADLRVAVNDLQISNITDLVQTDVETSGLLTLEGRLRGTMRSPRFEGAAALADARYRGSPIPNVRTTFRYADQSLTLRGDALRNTGAPLATVDATLPINLALSGVTGDRLLDRGMRVDVVGDSLPLDLLPRFTEAVSDLSGRAVGRLALRGALRRPTLVGAVAVHNAAARINPLGIDVREINGAIRMTGDTVVIDSLVGRSKGLIRVSGGLGVGNWREPSFNLFLVASDAKVMDNDQGELHVDAGLRLTGPFREPYASGQVTLLHGVLYVPSGGQKRLVSSGDPAIFAVLDTSVMSDRELLPARNPLVSNLRMDIDVDVNRSTWVRSRDFNIEMFTEAPLHISRRGDQFALTGIVQTDRGEYEFMSKRFEVRRGAATFIGSPELNPTLQLAAEYEVRLPARPALNIRVLVGGTLQRPRVTLESDAQPPIAQTDLLSFLAFGTESQSLLAIAGSALTAGGSGSGAQTLSGVGNIAARRLAAVALGVAIDEAEGEAGRDLGVDVINIRPADIPDFKGSAWTEFVLSTELEAGKYVNPNTFVAFEGGPSFLQRGDCPKALPGLRLEHRTPAGYRIETSFEPRFLLKPPTLAQDATQRCSNKQIAGTSAFGLFVFREWRF